MKDKIKEVHIIKETDNSYPSIVLLTDSGKLLRLILKDGSGWTNLTPTELLDNE